MYNQQKCLELLNAFLDAEHSFRNTPLGLLAVTKAGRERVGQLPGFEEVGHVQNPFDNRVHDLWLFGGTELEKSREALTRFCELATRGGTVLPDIVRNTAMNRPRGDSTRLPHFTIPADINWWFEFLWHFYPGKSDIIDILSNPDLSSRPLVLWENAFQAAVDAMRACGLGTHKITLPTKPIRIWHDHGTVFGTFGPNMVIPPETELWNEAIDGPLPDLVELEDFELMQGLLRVGDTLIFNADVGRERTRERDEFEAWQQAEGIRQQRARDEGDAERIVALLKLKGLKLVADNDSEKPTEKESNILEAIGDETLRASKIAELAGYPYGSSLRACLSSMRKRGLLELTIDGYRKPT